jgi:DUF309 family protein family protein
MNLALRDRIAEWALDALAGGREAPLRALAAFAEAAGPDGTASGLGTEEARLLESGGHFERIAPQTVRLIPSLLADLAALRWRAARFAEAVAAARQACGEPRDELGWQLCAAGALFERELYFEVHELLEPPWREADGPLKSFLQGLIQVAVGLHHQANGNLRGAVSLLAEGAAKLAPLRPEAYGVELADFCRAVEELAGALRGGTPVPADRRPLLLLRHCSDETR